MLRLLSAGLGFVAITALACACSDAPHPPPEVVGAPAESSQSARPETCAPEGAARECSVTLPSHDGVPHCAKGIQVCEAGAWGACKLPSSAPDAGAGADASEPSAIPVEGDSTS
jgi:hypothetical protein